MCLDYTTERAVVEFERGPARLADRLGLGVDPECLAQLCARALGGGGDALDDDARDDDDNREPLRAAKSDADDGGGKAGADDGAEPDAARELAAFAAAAGRGVGAAVLGGRGGRARGSRRGGARRAAARGGRARRAARAAPRRGGGGGGGGGSGAGAGADSAASGGADAAAAALRAASSAYATSRPRSRARRGCARRSPGSRPRPRAPSAARGAARAAAAARRAAPPDPAARRARRRARLAALARALVARQRALLLAHRKNALLDECLRASDTNPAQFDLTLSRLRARAHHEAGRCDRRARWSVFGQCFRQMHHRPDATFRKRGKLFNTVLAGEHAHDAGGPYREVWSQLAAELESDGLPLLLPTPNGVEGIGHNRERWCSTLPLPRRAAARRARDALSSSAS